MARSAVHRHVALPVLVGFFFVVYSLIGLTRHWQFKSSAYDLAIFDQLLWRLSRFEPPESSVRGVTNLFGDHFDPIVALLVPAYWIVPAPETLIVAQALLFAVSIVPVFLFARGRLGQTVAVLIATAYGFFWGLQRAAEFDFHDYAFAPLLIALVVLGIARRSWRMMWVSGIALVFVKEDVIPVLGFAGLYLFVIGERARGVLLGAFAVVAFVAVVAWIVPAANDGAAYGYTEAYAEVLRAPWTAPAVLVTPAEKVRTAFLWVAPFALLPLLSPWALLLIPFVLTRFLSGSRAHWGVILHYSAPLAPIVAVAAADGLARLAVRVPRMRSPRALTTYACACVVLSAILPGQQPFWDLFEPGQYVQSAMVRTGHEVVRSLPRDASVVAQAAIVPHLAHREAIYVLDADAPDAEFVIAAPRLSPWPLKDSAAVAALVDARRRRGYEVIFEQDGWIVLRAQTTRRD